MNELISDLLDVFLKHNVVDKHSLRNFLVKQRYKELYRNQKMKSKDARRLIANEFNFSKKQNRNMHPCIQTTLHFS